MKKHLEYFLREKVKYKWDTVLFVDWNSKVANVSCEYLSPVWIGSKISIWLTFSLVIAGDEMWSKPKLKKAIFYPDWNEKSKQSKSLHA